MKSHSFNHIDPFCTICGIPWAEVNKKSCKKVTKMKKWEIQQQAKGYLTWEEYLKACQEDEVIFCAI